MGDDGWSPHCGGWTGPGWGRVTCSYAGPSAGGASPGAGPGSSHRRLWGQGLAPEPPAAPGSVSLGTGYRSAPPPGWTGTVGGETRALVGRIWKTDLTRKASPPPAPSWGSGVLTGRPLCQTGQSSGEGPAGPGSAEMGSIWGVPSPLLDPSPAPCSCVPSAASAPTASSSPGLGSRAPPRLQSPGSPLHTRGLRMAMGAETRGRVRWVMVRKSPPIPTPMGT